MFGLFTIPKDLYNKMFPSYQWSLELSVNHITAYILFFESAKQAAEHMLAEMRFIGENDDNTEVSNHNLDFVLNFVPDNITQNSIFKTYRTNSMKRETLSYSLNKIPIN